jgi:glutamine synthetase
MTPTDLKELVKKHNIKMIDAKFVDFLGQWKHLTYPIERLE